jgi:hypothetical protein
MENIKVLYTFALAYGFISLETYGQVISKNNVSQENTEELIHSQAEEYLYV